jgi:hypothetical protein
MQPIKTGIGIEQTNSVIGIPAFIIPVWYRSKKMQDFIGLVRFWTGPSTVSFFYLAPD